MATQYDILQDYQVTGDHIQVTAGVVVFFVRYQRPAAFDKRLGQSSQTEADAVRLPHIVASGAVQSATCTQNLKTHLGQATISLRPSLNWQEEIFPGDHVFVWMVQSEKARKDLIQKLSEGKPANEFNDGLKFWGKVQTIQGSGAVSPDGRQNVVTQVSAVSFSELDASVYWEPHFRGNVVGLLSQWLHYFGTSISSIIQRSNGGAIDTNQIMPELMDVFFVRGVPKDLKYEGPGVPITQGADSPDALPVPGPVANVFGVQKGTKPGGKIAFTDVTHFLHGVQKYTDGEGANVFLPPTIDSQNFQDSTVHYTGTPQIGSYVPTPPAMTGQHSFWSLIQQFVNPTTNHMYTTLRVGQDQQVFPFVVYRQLPYTSQAWSERNPNIAHTPFLSIPRWVISTKLLRRWSVGRSDALRANFVFLMGEGGPNEGWNPTGEAARVPPLEDPIDALRHGLRPHIRTVPASHKDIVENKRQVWQELFTDFVFNGQMQLSGQLETEGIVAPICVGDNCQIGDTVLHIEGVSHTFNSDGNGNANFRTSLTVTHGVNVNESAESDTPADVPGPTVLVDGE